MLMIYVQIIKDGRCGVSRQRKQIHVDWALGIGPLGWADLDREVVVLA